MLHRRCRFTEETSYKQKKRRRRREEEEDDDNDDGEKKKNKKKNRKRRDDVLRSQAMLTQYGFCVEQAHNLSNFAELRETWEINVSSAGTVAGDYCADFILHCSR